MSHFGDHDGKSTTASAVDRDHYPEIDDSKDGHAPAYDDIAKLAHELWTQRGCPSDSSEQDWLEAENQLRVGRGSKQLLRNLHDKAGSVQS